MADDKNNSDEPSIEEILSSIREIISDEDEEGTEQPAASQEDKPVEPEPAVQQDEPAKAEPEQQEEPAEAEPAAEPEPVSAPEPEAETVATEDEDVLDLAAFAEEDDIDEPADPLEGIDLNHPESDDLDMIDGEEEPDDGISDIIGSVEAEPEEDNRVEDDNEPLVAEADHLIDQVAESATVGAMARLAENISLARTSEGVTLEDIVRDLLRPMLKDWLDDNLPEIIERLVSQELERLAQKAVRK